MGQDLCNSTGKPELSMGLGFAAPISSCFHSSKALPGWLFRDFLAGVGPGQVCDLKISVLLQINNLLFLIRTSCRGWWLWKGLWLCA